MMEFTVRMPMVDDLDNTAKCAIIRSVVPALYVEGFGVAVITFPDGDTNDCDAPAREN